jgi:hypothetical protein
MKTLNHPVRRSTPQGLQFATQNATLTSSLLLFLARQPPIGPGPPHYRGFTITLRHTALGSTSLDDWWACRRDLHLTTHNTHTRQTSMPPAGFKPTIRTSERPQTHVLNRAVTAIGTSLVTTDYWLKFSDIPWSRKEITRTNQRRPLSYVILSRFM